MAARYRRAVVERDLRRIEFEIRLQRDEACLIGLIAVLSEVDRRSQNDRNPILSAGERLFNQNS